MSEALSQKHVHFVNKLASLLDHPADFLCAEDGVESPLGKGSTFTLLLPARFVNFDIKWPT